MKSKAFTLVELVVVITVIGILAAITIVGYGNWRQSVDESVVKSDLQAVAAAMENYRNFNSGYPTDNVRNSLFHWSDGVGLISSAGNADGYLICANKTNANYYYCVSHNDKSPVRHTYP